MFVLYFIGGQIVGGVWIGWMVKDEIADPVGLAMLIPLFLVSWVGVRANGGWIRRGIQWGAWPLAPILSCAPLRYDPVPLEAQIACGAIGMILVLGVTLSIVVPLFR